MRMPGTIPAANNRPMETSAILPYKTSPIPGGIIVVMSALLPMTAAENPPEYPCLIMPGPSMRESMVASPIAELVIPPSDAAITMLLCAIPPRICPVIIDASFMTRSVRPVSLSRLPAKTNNGMASRRKFWVWESTC